MAMILIADDDLLGRQMIEQNLQDDGYQVIGVSNGVEALAMIRSAFPDLILADVLMPGMDGYTLCHACKSDPQLRRIPFILYSSSFITPKEQQLGLDFGADRYLVKPVVPDELTESVRQLLQSVPQCEGSCNLLQEDEAALLRSFNELLYSKLNTKLLELQATQSRLLQNEKLATIGQMAAGVAHEINNPLAFITSNLNSLQEYLERYTIYFQAVQEQLKNCADCPVGEQLDQLRKRLKLDRIMADTPELLADCQDGAERMRQIVLDLRSFSRADLAEKVPADLHEVLKTALNVGHNELKQTARVELKLGELPKIACYPQQLGQVFLNLLVNAAQSIEKQGTITVTSWAESSQVCISIADTGNGMSEEVQKQIFEPFFTTKEPGKGTGLGLPISAEIIRKHGGVISVQSEPGKGTCFLITLPITIVNTDTRP